MRQRTMKQIFRSSLLALCAGGLCSVALAKLPAPTPEAAAKAAEAAAKAAWSGKVRQLQALPGARPRGGALPQDGQGRQARRRIRTLRRPRPIRLHAAGCEAD